MSLGKISDNLIKLLLEQGITSTTSNKVSNGEDISIFDYADEIETYMENEIEVPKGFESMDVSTFLDMDIQNGQFVEVEDTQNNANISDIIETGEGTEEEAESQAEDEAQTEGEIEKESTNFLTKIINSLLQDKRVKKAIDTDDNGQLSSTEIKEFLKQIKDIDGNGKDISIKDILGSISGIKKELGDEAEDTLENNNAEVPAIDNTQTSEAPSAPQINSQPSTGGNTVAQGLGAGSNEETNLPSKDPSQMSLKELEEAQPKAQSNLQEKQSALDSAIDGTSPEMQQLQANVDQAFTTYTELLETVQTEEETYAEDISAKKEEIDTQKQTINNKEKEIETKNTEIESHKSNITSIESSISSLQSTIASLQSSLSNEDADTSAINGQISALRNEIQGLEQSKAKEKEALQEAENQKTNLEKEKLDAETKLEDLQSELTELETAAEQAHPEVAEARQAYDEAQSTFDSEKATAVQTAKTELESARTYLNDISSNITKKDTEKVQDNAMNEAGLGNSKFVTDIIEKMKERLGSGFDARYLENTGLTIDHLGNAWCAAFVKDIMENTAGYEEQAADWYKDMPYHRKSSCYSIYEAAKAGDALVNKEDAKAGQFIIYDWNCDGEKDHIGIITDVNQNTGEYTVIEGNATGGVVKEITYQLDDVNFNYYIADPFKQ